MQGPTGREAAFFNAICVICRRAIMPSGAGLLSRNNLVDFGDSLLPFRRTSTNYEDPFPRLKSKQNRASRLMLAQWMKGDRP